MFLISYIFAWVFLSGTSAQWL